MTGVVPGTLLWPPSALGVALWPMVRTYVTVTESKVLMK